MGVAIITGSAGLIGAEAARFFADKGLEIVGIDNICDATSLASKLARPGIVSVSRPSSRVIDTMT